MSNYRKKANLKDSIISLVVVLCILGAAIYALVNQFSEVDLTKQELEELRAAVKLEEVELLDKKDEWALKVQEDQEVLAIKHEQLIIEQENFAAMKDKLAVDTQKSIQEAKTELQANYDLEIEKHKEYEDELKAKIRQLEAQNKKIVAASKAPAVSKAPKQTASTTNSSGKKAAEQSVQRLMKRFVSLDVDLKKPNWCDKAYSQKFNEASNILNAIDGMAKKYDLAASYGAFVSANARSSSSTAGDGWCNGVKVQ